jgi:hypothetical protein
MKCDCEDWAANIDHLNAPTLLLHARNPQSYKGYTGKRFVFCPWCSAVLAQDTPAPGAPK